MTTVTESSRTRTALIAEVTAGTQPAGSMLILPKSACSLKDAISTRASELIRSDRNVAGMVKVGKAVGGSISSELFYSPSGEALQLLMAGALSTTLTAATTQITGVTCTSNVLSGGSGNLDTNVEVGDIVRVRTSGDVLVGYFPVTVVNAGAHTLTVGGTISNASNLKVQRGARMKNGTTDSSFTIEHARLDTALYRQFCGMAVSSMGISIADEQLSKVEFGFEGMSSARATSTYAASGTTDPTAADTYSSTSVPTFMVGGATYEAQSIDVTFAANTRSRRIIGTDGPASIGRGNLVVTGSINSYLANWTELTKYSAGTASSLQIVVTDATGNAFAIALPNVKYTDGNENTDRANSDDMARLRFQAVLDSTQLITARLLQWAA